MTTANTLQASTLQASVLRAPSPDAVCTCTHGVHCDCHVPADELASEEMRGVLTGCAARTTPWCEPAFIGHEVDVAQVA